MVRLLSVSLIALVATATASAHFIFVVPASDGKSATAIFSENLDPDPQVGIGLIASLKLTALTADGKPQALTCTKGKESLAVTCPEGIQALYGQFDFGVMARGNAPPYLLRYHPKAVLGADSKFSRLGDRVPVEIVPVVEDSKVKFLLLAKGKPVPMVEMVLILPDGFPEKVTTGDDGTTKSFPAKGRYGAWTRYFEDVEGNVGDKAYKQIRHYPSLVVELGGSATPKDGGDNDE